MRVIVTGGRRLWPGPAGWAWLEAEAGPPGTWSLLVGDCPTGVDAWVWQQAVRRAWPRLQIHAPWQQSGRGAGPRRNRAMARYAALGPALCLAFPGGRGTASMCREAARRGIPVRRYAGARGEAPC